MTTILGKFISNSAKLSRISVCASLMLYQTPVLLLCFIKLEDFNLAHDETFRRLVTGKGPFDQKKLTYRWAITVRILWTASPDSCNTETLVSEIPA